METHTPTWTLGDLASMPGGTAFHAPDKIVRRPVPAESDDPDGIAFCESEAYLAKALKREVGALLLPPNLSTDAKPYIQVSHPSLAFGMLLGMARKELPSAPGIHSTAIIDASAEIDPTASIGAYAIVERGARVGANCRVFPFCYVGEECELGEGTTLYPHVVMYQRVKLGKGCIVHSGAILGADGFGFIWDGRTQIKVPQVGDIAIGSDVEIGANSTVDRATAGTTKIGEGTKLDNMVQVAHNVQIGRNTVIAAQTGIGGSTTIGDHVTMGGHCAIADHVTIVSDTTFGGSSQMPSDIDEPGAYFGAPAIPGREGLRAYKLRSKLPEMLNRIRSLEKRLLELEEKES